MLGSSEKRANPKDQEKKKKKVETHCFSSVTVGLTRHRKYYKELTIDPSNFEYSMSNFRKFLRENVAVRPVTMRSNQRRRPRMLILARGRSRVFTNAGAIARAAK
ncbi:hypothetical protein BRARA_E03384 [Brassica rapa]|uniref:Uncharacterized protein n=1 Tax=Brassica campestris TaxID=3711 RepID=A0A397ZFN1_BRACM|nr:hypothetical protein BRARA_E03384 [Brassica rapa]